MGFKFCNLVTYIMIFIGLIIIAIFDKSIDDEAAFEKVENKVGNAVWFINNNDGLMWFLFFLLILALFALVAILVFVLKGAAQWI